MVYYSEVAGLTSHWHVAGSWDRAEATLSLQRRVRVEPGIMSYGRVLRVSTWPVAGRLLLEAGARQLQMNLVTYTSTLSACEKLGGARMRAYLRAKECKTMLKTHL